MKIALINLYPVVGSSGGAEKVFCEMANAFVEQGHKVCAITSDKDEGVPYFKLDERVVFRNMYPRSKTVGYHLERAFCFFKINRKAKMAKLKLLWKGKPIAELMEKFLPDIVIAFQMEGAYVIDHCMSNNIPYITMFHGSPRNSYWNQVNADLYISSVKKSVAIQVLSKEFVRDVQEKIGSSEKICVIPNCVVPKAPPNNNRREKRIINVGRVSPEKRQDLLIQSISKISKYLRDNSWKVEVWGGIPEKNSYTKKVRKLIEENQISDIFELCGTTKDIDSVYSRSSIFILPSETEGWSLALAEAMASGLPAIGCSSCPSVNEIIKNGESGFLCEDSPQDIADKLLMLMENEELRERFGKRSIELMREYSPEVVWGKWDKLLRDVVEKSKRG